MPQGKLPLFSATSAAMCVEFAKTLAESFANHKAAYGRPSSPVVVDPSLLPGLAEKTITGFKSAKKVKKLEDDLAPPRRCHHE